MPNTGRNKSDASEMLWQDVGHCCHANRLTTRLYNCTDVSHQTPDVCHCTPKFDCIADNFSTVLLILFHCTAVFHPVAGGGCKQCAQQVHPHNPE